MTAFTCPHCAGPIAFDADAQTMTCAYCDSVFSLEEFRREAGKAGRMVLNEASCPQCGATLLTTDTTTATFCSYCGSSVALENRLVEEDLPEKIIPFKVSKNQAEKLYRKKIHRTLLAPDWMEDPENTAKFRGIYMPFHIFRFTHNGRWEGQTTTTTLQRIGGKEYDVTRTYDIGASVDVDYDYIPVDAASGFPDGMSRAVCPYRREKERNFELPYFAGFYADRGNVDAALYENRYKELVKQDIDTKANIRCGSVDIPSSQVTKNIQLQTSTKTSLFPVWFLSFRNKDRVNYACVNGDTGEVAADIPIDFWKYLKASLIVAALFSVILNLFLTIKPSNLLCVTALIAAVAFVIANRLLNNTYRRVKHWDDIGYLGEEKDKVIHYRQGHVFWRTALNMVIASTAVFVVLMILVMLDINDEICVDLILGTFFFMPIYLIVTVNRLKNNQKGIRTKNAPLWYKLLVLIKPLLAVAACLVVGLGTGVIDGAVYQLLVVDEYCYAAAFFGIAMIIWTAFDVVLAQNRFTMRDIPIFTEQRGGDE